MPRGATPAHRCESCGARTSGPMGRCPGCGAWGTVVPVAATGPASGRGAGAKGAARPVAVSTLDQAEASETVRLPSGDAEVDRVLGGGWVPGGVALVAGEPGVGKSTLLLQLAQHAVAAGRSVLYVAGEESPAQIALRAKRLGIAGNLTLTREVDAAALAAHLEAERPDFVIIDSVQSLRADPDGVPGGVTQVRDATARLTEAAKRSGAALVLIGHVTKEGKVAGPKVVEHIVDATFALESAAGFRVLRARKNRFGAAGEVGVFAMREGGLEAVPNPSDAFLAERPRGVPGSVVVAALEGQRPLLLEVQALASKSPYPSPKRVVQGLDARRVDVVLAVLERRLELPLSGLDVFVNVAGGLRVTDPGADAAVALAVWSAVVNRALPENAAVVGEVGLAGEIRGVTQLERRAAEARRAGYTLAVAPAGDGRTGTPDLAAAIRSFARGGAPPRAAEPEGEDGPAGGGERPERARVRS